MGKLGIVNFCFGIHKIILLFEWDTYTKNAWYYAIYDFDEDNYKRMHEYSVVYEALEQIRKSERLDHQGKRRRKE